MAVQTETQAAPLPAVIDASAIPAAARDTSSANEVADLMYAFAYGAILLLGVVLYVGCMTGRLIWDDNFIMSGSAIGGGDSLWHCLTKPFLVNYYRPMVSVSFYLEHFISKNTPLYYHQSNILLHVLTTWFLMRALWEAFRVRAIVLFGGLFFAVQPTQVDAVAWIGGRTDSLCALWVALFAWTFLRSFRVKDAQRRKWLAWSVFAFAGALFTKEQVLPILLLIPFGAWCFRKPGSRPTWREIARFSAPFIAVTVIYIALYEICGPPPPDRISESPNEVVAQFFRTITFYTLLFVAPTDRWMNTMSLGAFARAGVWPLLSGAAIVAAFLVGTWKLSRREPAAAWLLALAGMALVVVSNIWPVPSMLVAPYRAGATGVAMAGFMAWMLWRLAIPASGSQIETCYNEADVDVEAPRTAAPRWRRLTACAIGVGFAAWCGFLVANGAGKWQTDIEAATRIVKYDPDSIWGHLNLTTGLLNAGKKEPASREIENLLQNLFGSNAWRSGETAFHAMDTEPQILRHVHEVQGTRKDPKQWVSAIYNQLAFAQMDTGDRNSALKNFNISWRLYPQKNPEALLGLGTLALAKNEYEKAASHLRAAVLLDPDSNEGHAKLGRALAGLERWQEAQKEFRICISQQPWVGRAYVELANAQYHAGDRAAAEKTLTDAIKKCPGRTDLQDKLAEIESSAAPPDTSDKLGKDTKS